MLKPPENHPELILASTSTARVTIFRNLKLPFRPIAPQFAESEDLSLAPATRALENGRGKALSIDASISNPCALPPLVIGSDQVCTSASGQTLHKPGKRGRAVDQLRQVSNQWVSFYTSVVVAQSSIVLSESVVQSRVKFRSLNDAQIERYVDADQPYHSAGSLLLEGAGLRLIQQIDTPDINALYGFPAIKLLDLLDQLGFELSYHTSSELS